MKSNHFLLHKYITSCFLKLLEWPPCACPAIAIARVADSTIATYQIIKIKSRLKKTLICLVQNDSKRHAITVEFTHL